jgi:hypothetical protein
MYNLLIPKRHLRGDGNYKEEKQPKTATTRNKDLYNHRKNI